jgi:thiol-disulfide isomerase/thioredoxin
MLDRVFVALILIALAIVGYTGWRWRFMRRATAAAPATGRPGILYFSTAHCAPCLTQWQFLEQVCSQLGRAVNIEMIDAEEYPDLASTYGVFTVPTTLVIDSKGQVRHANYGLAQPRKLLSQLSDVAAAV